MNSIFFRNSKLRVVFNFWAQIAKTTNRLCRSWQRSNFRAASTCGRSSAIPTIRAKVTPTSFFRGKLLLRSNFRSLSLPRLMRFLFLLHTFSQKDVWKLTLLRKRMIILESNPRSSLSASFCAGPIQRWSCKPGRRSMSSTSLGSTPTGQPSLPATSEAASTSFRSDLSPFSLFKFFL